MADEANSDILMFLKLKDAPTAIAAEATSSVVSSDRLMGGFRPGYFFEVESLNFGLELIDDEKTAEVLTGNETRSYARWRALPANRLKPTPPFYAEASDMSVTRKIDSSSPILLKSCLGTMEFEKAVLIKRARIGMRGMKTVVLRLEFYKVWLRSIDWKDGDAVKETCKFKYSAMRMIYAKVRPDGMPGPTSSSKWQSEPTFQFPPENAYG